jgi:hypothetical protein
MCKKKIESTLRVYIWKMFNMGGYNNKRIDLSRSTTISDVLGDTDLSIDDVMQNTYQDDFTAPEVRDFFDSLSDKNKRLLIAIMAGHELRNVSRMWGQAVQTICERLERIRKKYINYEKAASAA